MSAGSVVGLSVDRRVDGDAVVGRSGRAARGSVAVTVKVSVPVVMGVPVMVSVLVPLLGTVRPAIALMMLVTVRVEVPLTPVAAMVWL